MLKLINAKTAAEETTVNVLKKEIPMINDLITMAELDGECYVKINVNDYSSAMRTLLERSGYDVKYEGFSWAHVTIKTEENKKIFKRVLKRIRKKLQNTELYFLDRTQNN